VPPADVDPDQLGKSGIDAEQFPSPTPFGLSQTEVLQIAFFEPVSSSSQLPEPA
jgi:hypothetical protein